MDMKNKVVWITGASSGIGEALAYKYGDAGARLIISARNAQKLNEVKAKCKYPDNVEVLEMDVVKHDRMTHYAQHVLQQYGMIDILVNNAGISQRGKVEDNDANVDKQIFDVNFFGATYLTKAVLPSMLERKSGNIVVISSIVGKVATPYRSAYAASKHALHGWFDALRAEIHDRNVHVNIICPGYIRTMVSVNALSPDGSKHDVMDDNQDQGMDPMRCADKILKAVDANKSETYIGGKETNYVLLKRFLPGTFEKAIRGRKF